MKYSMKRYLHQVIKFQLLVDYYENQIQFIQKNLWILKILGNLSETKSKYILNKNLSNLSQDSFENEEDSININDVDFENLSIKYNENEDKPSSDTNDSAIDINNNNMNGSKLNGQQVKMPLPYKVAKSLDPVIYRNTAFDAWIANKKESEECLNQKLIMQLKQGDKCFVRINNYFGTNWILAYMQSINTNNTAYVFIPDLNDRYD